MCITHHSSESAQSRLLHAPSPVASVAPVACCCTCCMLLHAVAPVACCCTCCMLLHAVAPVACCCMLLHMLHAVAPVACCCMLLHMLQVLHTCNSETDETPRLFLTAVDADVRACSACSQPEHTEHPNMTEHPNTQHISRRSRRVQPAPQMLNGNFRVEGMM